MQKYALLRQRVLESGLVAPTDLLIPEAATDEQLQYAHRRDYVHKVKTGTLSDKEIKRIGFPWSPALVERSRRSVGGTISACRAARTDNIAVNLAGGTHHAFRDHGAGFCVFNDVAVAALTMQIEDDIRRIAILDCDVHQGDGTASILTDCPDIFTFSIHGAHNFPFHKQRSDLDIALDDGTSDEVYLAALRKGISRALELAQADLVIYLAGADPYEGDRLGRLAVSKEGLTERDRFVFAVCQTMRIPVAVVMAGGYARQIEDIVDIHLQTRTAASFT